MRVATGQKGYLAIFARTLRPYPILGGLFTVCVLAYLITIPLPRVDGMLIGSDGVGYFMYVHSLVIDRDLNFQNEYMQLYGTTPVPTATGLYANQFAIGPGIMWMPFFAVPQKSLLTRVSTRGGPTCW